MANYNSFCYTGHGFRNNGSFDPGATGNNRREYDIAKSITDKIKVYLDNTGLSIHYGENNYSNNLTNGNSYTARWGVSIHVNSGGGVGSEVLVPCGEKDLSFEFGILDEMKNLGFTIRGVKSRDYDTERWFQRQNGVALSNKDYFGEIRQAWNLNPKASLSIIEVGFIDNLGDVQKIESNYDEIAFIIAKYIAKGCGVTLEKPAGIDYEKEVCRILVDGVNKIALTGKSKCENYARENFVGGIKIQCVKDSAIISDFYVAPPVSNDTGKDEEIKKLKDEIHHLNGVIREMSIQMELYEDEKERLSNKISDIIEVCKR